MLLLVPLVFADDNYRFCGQIIGDDKSDDLLAVGDCDVVMDNLRDVSVKPSVASHAPQFFEGNSYVEVRPTQQGIMSKFADGRRVVA